MKNNEYNNGRVVKYVNEWTFTGQQLLARAACNIGTELSDVYSYWSNEKSEAYKNCWDMYTSDDNARNFRIVSRNTNQFSVAWDTLAETVLLTSAYEYHIIKRV